MKKKLYHQFACSSLMLPEHRARLARHRQKKAWEAKQNLPGPPDEQQLEQFQRLVEQSMNSGLPLKISCVENGNICRFTGVVQKQQPDPGRLRLQAEGRVLAIPVSAIVRLEAAP
ncbi:MAG TPA: YolD-like family protein [Bacillota bacterium]|jgi:hypothetical protein|nr:YolD-like family protein [Bacillota bacterium]HOA36227.1 YolD-like family protein [Bacillota bacterium]HOJ83719.1 YolD-like family protein [Bacillota bacterium]HOL15863.1 YolD-like family protein [Bacillota bacterium]HPZ11945.1 YolD-like family protein [Bacillota bacterium]